MVVEISYNKNRVEFIGDNAFLTACEGVSDLSMKSLSSRLGDKWLRSRITHNLDGSDFVAVFNIEPPLDSTLACKGPLMQVTMCAYDEHSGRKGLDELLMNLGLVGRGPSELFVKELKLLFEIERGKMRQVLQASAALGVDGWRVWGASNYANFLQKYAAVKVPNPLRTAWERYGLPAEAIDV